MKIQNDDHHDDGFNGISFYFTFFLVCAVITFLVDGF